MNNLAGKLIPMHKTDESVIKTGVVVSLKTDEIRVDLDGNIKSAQKAFSCLIDLQVNDIIICSEINNGNIYILGIIERPGSQKINMNFPSDTILQTRQGSIGLHSTDNVTIASKGINLFSKNAIHKSNEAIISYGNTIAKGEELQANFKRVSFISNLINTMAKQVINKFKGYIRSTEDNDMVKSGQMTRKTDGLYSMDSKHTIMNSKNSTKIDGEKILMG
jgi:hypothetical protein